MRRNAFLPLLAVILSSLVAVGQSSRPAAPTPTAPQKQANAAAPASPVTFETAVQPFLAKNCVGCHNEKLSSGKLNLTQYKTRASVATDRERWEILLKRVRAGEMPPAGMPRPSEAELHAATKWIEGEMDRLDATAKPDPGRVTARRLNRAEYNNTIRDLLGVEFRPADDFPQDDTGYGFDTIGDVLSLSTVQMEKYLAAAETVARTAVYGPQVSKPTMARFQHAGRRRPGDFDNLFFNTHPWLSVTDYDETGLSMPNSLHATYLFPATAEYVIRATPDNGSRPPGSEPLEMAVFVDGKMIGQASIDGQLEGKTQSFRTTVTAGEHWVAVGFPRQFEGLPAAYGAKNPSKRPVPVGGRRGNFNGAPGGGGLGRGANGAPGAPGPNGAPGANGAPAAPGAGGAAGPNLAGAPGGGTPLLGPPGAAPNGGRGGRGGRGGANAANANNNNDDAASNIFYTPAGAPAGTRLARPDNMGVQSLEIGGPYNPEINPSAESVKKVLICDLNAAGCDRKIITNLARLAFRRPVTKEDIDPLMAQVARVKARGDSAQEQLVVGIEAMLVSPNFLFRIEKDRAPRAGLAKVSTAAAGPTVANADSYYLSDHELASRLSYFLWSSMPDEPLLRAADAGTLRRPEVLTAQVRRMLQDPKISRFVENFGGQWLQFRALESHQPDFYLFPAYDAYLRMSMVKETELFFENIVKEDRNIGEFLDADYTFLNQYLAEYYGMRDVKGPEFRKVSLANTKRRGILGQASMLTVSSYGNRTSVVLRGKWVLENLLNSPPPPPPPNVPDLDQAKVAPDATLRQKMEAHRTNAVCASCHSKMDPIGLGLENFDAIGNWREKDGKNPIDASGVLPDGRKFNGPVELANLLRSQSDAFAQCVTEKTMIYALGRGLEPYDRLAVKKIVTGLGANQYRFSSLILEIVKSMPFQMRRGERAKV